MYKSIYQLQSLHNDLLNHKLNTLNTITTKTIKQRDITASQLRNHIVV